MSSIFWTEQTGLPKSMKIALVGSALFHVVLVLAGTIGLPFIQKPLTIPPAPIAVEIVDISDMPTTNKPPTPQKLKPIKTEPKVEPKMVAPPKVEAKAPPKVTPLEKPPEKKKETVKPEPKTPPPPSEKLEKPKEKPPEKKPEPKPEPKKEEAIQQEDPMASLLKNLQESEPSSAETSPDAPLAPTMTSHELSALSNQLIGCWQIPIGAKNVHNMVVNVRVWPNADRTVRKVEIANDGWLNSDPSFRALAESARRAVQDPRCSPLDIPMDKYEVWRDKYIEVPFDPSKVL